jgi:hypothetical protein
MFPDRAFPHPALHQAVGVASPEESPHGLHTASTSSAIKTPVIDVRRPGTAWPGVAWPR